MKAQRRPRNLYDLVQALSLCVNAKWIALACTLTWLACACVRSNVIDPCATWGAAQDFAVPQADGTTGSVELETCAESKPGRQPDVRAMYPRTQIIIFELIDLPKRGEP